jgi:hypothetical protein
MGARHAELFELYSATRALKSAREPDMAVLRRRLTYAAASAATGDEDVEHVARCGVLDVTQQVQEVRRTGLRQVITDVLTFQPNLISPPSPPAASCGL